MKFFWISVAIDIAAAAAIDPSQQFKDGVARGKGNYDALQECLKSMKCESAAGIAQYLAAGRMLDPPDFYPSGQGPPQGYFADLIAKIGISKEQDYAPYTIQSTTRQDSFFYQGALAAKSGIPSAFVEIDSERKPKSDALHWSDSIYYTWEHFAYNQRVDVSSLRHIVRIPYAEKDGLLEQVYKEYNIKNNDIQEWKIDGKLDDGFFAILSHPAASGVAFMLKDHVSRMKLNIVKIRTLQDPDWRRWYVAVELAPPSDGQLVDL